MKRVIVLSLVMLLLGGCSEEPSFVVDPRTNTDDDNQPSLPKYGHVLIRNTKDQSISKIEISNAYFVRQNGEDCILFTNYDYQDVVSRFSDHNLFQCLFTGFNVNRVSCHFDHARVGVIRGGLNVFRYSLYGKRGYGYDKDIYIDSSVVPKIKSCSVDSKGVLEVQFDMMMKDFYDQMKLSVRYRGEVKDLRYTSRFRLGVAQLTLQQPMMTPHHKSTESVGRLSDIYFYKNRLLGLVTSGEDLYLTLVHGDGVMERLSKMKGVDSDVSLDVLNGHLYVHSTIESEILHRIDFKSYSAVGLKRFPVASSRIITEKESYFILRSGMVLKSDMEGEVLRRQYDNFSSRCLARNVGLLWTILYENDQVYLAGLDDRLQFVRAYHLVGMSVKKNRSFVVQSICSYSSNELLLLDEMNHIYRILLK
ncbi:hypothetical protein K5X82_15795 [Halosquirtibacter xylanolyticus]|uniref:hypothetical protein n=1 Tax=Halosquirtibacter xylanolyticus TaxID=3374599 RepID=UPI00374A0B20|nr:hypothetical protein K5X82_15795 [Prolixibacteraceae bacterium]